MDGAPYVETLNDLINVVFEGLQFLLKLGFEISLVRHLSIENLVNVTPHLFGLTRPVAVSRQGLIHGGQRPTISRLSLHTLASFLLFD
jgi:hypothetical protein